MLNDSLDKEELDLLISAESEKELGNASGSHSFVRVTSQNRAVALSLVHAGFMCRRDTGTDEFEITPKGQQYIVEMVGLR